MNTDKTVSREKKSNARRPITLTPGVLARWPLPRPDIDGDKDERGRVLILGGASEMPGGIILAATAALRAGAGKLQIATPAGIAPWIATAVPESRVFFLPELKSGGIAASSAAMLADRANGVDAVVIGPGAVDEAALARLLRRLLPAIDGPTVILDAAALAVFATDPNILATMRGRAIVTPHAGELATMLGIEKRDVRADPLNAARTAAEQFHCVVLLKGSATHIVSPTGNIHISTVGNVGLATSGSGDTLAGIVAGLAARGAAPEQAAAWGAFLHGSAGDLLARRVGRLGYLPRELLVEIPPLMEKLSRMKVKAT
ncbi:MAG: carbohydrate kinase [Chlorobi bacterium]|nr:carbohydrate kinase [Chlorobiota bacterium]